MNISTVRNAVKFYREEGARNTVARSLQRLASTVEVPSEARSEPIDIKGFYPPEALPLPMRKVRNRIGVQRLTLVLPTVSQKQLYAGAWTAIRIFWEAVTRNGFRARIISTETPFTYEGLDKLDFIGPGEIARIGSWDRGSDNPCDVEDDEIFIVTAWWTAYVIKDLEHSNRIFYLIQDFEPGFYSWSYKYVMALESYKFDYARIFNTSILYEFFREQKLLTGEKEIYFEPGIDTGLFHPGRKESYQQTGKATILLYGRPEVTRNLFELAILGLDRFFKDNPEYRGKVKEIISVGEKHAGLSVGGFEIESLGKLSMDGWGDLARRSDIGISLMCSPHPSYPPLEMVASGMLVVTNKIYNKDLSKINGNFLAADLDIEGMAMAFKDAVDRLADQAAIRKNAEGFLTERDWVRNLESITSFIAGNRHFGEEKPKG